MATLLKKHNKLRLPIILGALALLLAGGLAGGKWIVWPRVKAWREERTNNVAREKFSQGDYVSAMTAVRTSLRYNQQNLDTWKLGAQIAEKQKSPEEFTFLQRIALLQSTLDNKLKFIHFAVEKNAFPQALEMINKVGKEGAASADFQEIAALVNRRMNKTAAAKANLMGLVSLRPTDNNARFELAQLRMLDGYAENKPAIRNEIRNLASDPALRERALAILLADASEQKNANEALELAGQLATSLNIIPPHQLLILETYHRYAPGKAHAYLTQIQQSYADAPEKVVVLASYMNTSGQSAELCTWLDSLPEKTKEAEGVQTNYAYALLSLKKWPELETFLRGCKWKDGEFARHAMLAYKHRITGSERLFAEEWKLAVIEVGNNPRKLQTLLARTLAWRWQDERYELLWKRFSIDPSDIATRQQLVSWESSKGNTRGINRLFSRIIEASPQDTNAKNNFAYTSLLLGTNLERASEIARENLKSEPKNSFYITTQALALYKQNNAEDALQLLDSISATGLAQPDRTTMRALLLVETGKIQEGADLITNVRPNMLTLPEERRLYDTTLALITKAQREQGNVVRLATLTALHNNTPGDRKSWVAMLPEAFRKTVSVPMELADTFYASDDFAGLENALKSDRWETNDFLRLSLLSYAQKNQNRESSALSSWRTALASAGSNTANLFALAEICERWGWTQERIELFSRIFQRDALNQKVFTELVEHYTKTGQTADLARIHEQRGEANPNDFETKARSAYYSLLTGSNLSRAHVLAREAYDNAPDDLFRTKVYALSLLKQNRLGDTWRLLDPLPDQKDSGQAQTSLIKALASMQRKDQVQAKISLDLFDPATALPQEVSLAESLSLSIAKP